MNETANQADTAAESWFVEQMGLVAEADALPRIAGRVFGYLLLADAPQSLDEIAAALGVSKASVSTDARLLLERKLVERACRHGDRKDYYRIAPDFLQRIVEYRVSRWSALRDLVKAYRARSASTSSEVAQRLDDVRAAHEVLIERLQSAATAFEEERASASAGGAR